LEEEILQSQQENIHARRISTSPPKSKSSNDHTLDGPEVYESVFDFIKQQSISAEETLAANHHHRSNKGKKDIVKLNRSVATKKNVSDAPNPRSSLDDARIYFAELDQTQPLKLDCSQSPVLSSKITRTIRGVDLTSPGLQTDYETYVEVTVGSGVSPLPIEQFVSSRRMNMRKRGDLFDGFLDVDVGGDN
jgi:SUMO ligase MMS21 Smc5/6 complex component